MSRFRDPTLWSPVLPMMAVVRLGRELGLPGPTLVHTLRLGFLGGRVPKQLRAYRPREHDVFVAAFAKSGTNWALQIAQQLAWNGRSEFDHIHDVVPWPEAPLPGVAPLTNAPAQPSPTGRRIIKTHLPTEQLPDDPRLTYITVLRDPKEVVVSGYYFIVGIYGLLDVISFGQWFEMCILDRMVLTAWARHTAGFWAWRHRPNVLVQTYGQMSQDLPGAVRRFADVMALSPSDEVYAEVERRASFEYMRAREQQFAPPRLPLRTTAKVPSMMRRGRSGGSKEKLSPSQQAEIDRRAQAALRRLGCDLPYDELFGRRRSTSAGSTR